MKIVGIALVVLGIGLAIWGYQLSGSVGSQITQAVTGSDTVVGAVLGGFVFGLLGITTGGFLGSIVMATIGAVILLFIIGLVKKA